MVHGPWWYPSRFSGSFTSYGSCGPQPPASGCCGELLLAVAGQGYERITVCASVCSCFSSPPTLTSPPSRCTPRRWACVVLGRGVPSACGIDWRHVMFLAPRTVPSPNPRCRVQRGRRTLWLFGQSVVLLLWWARSTPLPPHRDAPPLTRLIATHLGRHRAGEHAYTGSCSLKPSAMATCGTARARSLEAACQFILLPRPIREREGVVGTAGAQRAIAADAPSRAWLVGARAGPAPDTYGCSPTNKLSLRGGWLVPDQLHFPERNVVLVLAFLQRRRPPSAIVVRTPPNVPPRRRGPGRFEGVVPKQVWY